MALANVECSRLRCDVRCWDADSTRRVSLSRFSLRMRLGPNRLGTVGISESAQRQRKSGRA
jgi:hypothetical protein